MANPAHEALLRQGVDEWNDWRAQNGSVTPDLTGLRLTAAVLDGIDLSHARLRGATLIPLEARGRRSAPCRPHETPSFTRSS